MKKLLVTIGILGLSFVSCAPAEDLVQELPMMPDLSFGLFSGYIPINGTTKQLHYLATLSYSDPQTDPVIIWFNGGPGCSSLLGWAQEHGPYVLEDNATEFIRNPYPWNKEATVIYVESPAGVGYSMCENPHDDDQYCAFNDANSADDNLIAVLNLMTMKFPEFQKNDLYLSGESYAGIYVPYLASRIHAHNEANKTVKGAYLPNLKGFMVGNPVTSWKYDTDPAFFEMAYSHQLIDRQLYQKTKQECPELFDEEMSMECYNLRNEYYDLTSNVNIYDIYGKCYSNNDPTLRLHDTNEFRYISDAKDQVKLSKKAVDYTPFLHWQRESFYHKYQKLGGQRPAKLGLIPHCVFGDIIEEYFRNSTVRFALNIPPEAPEWQLCTTINYERFTAGSIDIYKELSGKYRILVFSGNTDGAVPTIGTQMWIDELNWEVDELWRPYFVNGQTAGFVETREDETFVFATIHGAGHMAAQWKRAETYYVINQFIKGKRF